MSAITLCASMCLPYNAPGPGTTDLRYSLRYGTMLLLCKVRYHPTASCHYPPMTLLRDARY
eukprot:3400868-Rhodomonas_salina.1